MKPLWLILFFYFYIANAQLLNNQQNVPRFINKPVPLQAIVPLKASPGTIVYKLQARSGDLAYSKSIRYSIALDNAGNRFEVDEKTGDVRTRGNEPFILDKEYIIYVRAEDLQQSSHSYESRYATTGDTRLSIIGGRRAPQFYMDNYSKTIPEDTPKDSEIMEIKAISFADRDISYTLQMKNKGLGTFTIEPKTGRIRLTEELDYEDARKPQAYNLIVNASEDSGGFTSSTEFTLQVSDVNDNAPKFDLPDYQVYNVLEDVKIGTKITSIVATDADSLQNAKIEYSVDLPEFTIDSTGTIYTNRRLDADANNTYVLTVKATDKGTPQRSGTATVRVYTENTNDEPPKFSQEVYTPNIDENAGPRTLVTTVTATDKDGDNVYYGFDPSTKTNLFQIDEKTGVIRLADNFISLEKDKYELNVTARDDGECCPGKGVNINHTSRALVVVFITDVNDNQPVFQDCSTYNPTINENLPAYTYVTTVKATDADKGKNGVVRYSIVQQPNQKGAKFVIDEITGEIKSKKVFDREGTTDGQFVSITVRAADLGSPSLEGVCSFKVTILDVNDNPPLFDRFDYHENLRQGMSVGTQVMRVSAADEDTDLNGMIHYSLAPTQNPESRIGLDYFSINQDTGWITLMKPLDRDKFQLQAIARDRGKPPHNASVEINFDVFDRANSPPVWDQPVYSKKVFENEAVGSRILSIKASSGIQNNTKVFYSLIKGNTEQTNKERTFYLTPRIEGTHTYADIYTKHPLDYEKISSYNLTVRVENDGTQQLASECSVNIEIVDLNDEIPYFVESEKPIVSESMKPGTKVTQILALDSDGTSPYNEVYYEIDAQDSLEPFFSIDRKSGEIFTKVVFDREEKQSYSLIVRATDGAPSVLPGSNGKPNTITTDIRISIGDKNDNPPKFEKNLYEAFVKEDAAIHFPVVTVTARDPDESSKLRYEIVKGNVGGGAFAVNNETGVIYVAGPLDYELRKEYNLTVVCSDSLLESSVLVNIAIIDVNDNPPKFEKSIYNNFFLEEETPKELLPIRLGKVTANDPDRERPQNIVYFLYDEGNLGKDKNEKIDQYFSINSTTGEIYVKKPLDRDYPNGRSQWRFTVYAEDEGGHNGLVGFAEVVINLKDIDDNSPSFPNPVYIGNVTERGPPNQAVMTMQAVDYDDPNEGRNAKLEYFIDQNQMNDDLQAIFKINSTTGVIYTTFGDLDRETNPEYKLVIEAKDGGGHKGNVQAIIRVKDVNDMPPSFSKKYWEVEVDETIDGKLPDNPILVVQVNDGDLLETNRFSYTVLPDSLGSDKFTMVTNSDGTGSLKVAKPLDYEDPEQKYGFNITIQVFDGGDIADVVHTDTAKVFIKLKDVNDNPPEFNKLAIEVYIKEDRPPKTQLATFSAQDPDQDGRSKVTYSIDRSTDRRKQFRINPLTGRVDIQRPLDREIQSRMTIKILAHDDGVPQRTSVATLKVILEDVNDNPPRFLKDYVAIVYENTNPGKVGEFQAADSDDRASGNGPPFRFEMDPAASDLIKSLFEIQSDRSGEGSAVLYTKKVLDREFQKEYKIPVLISDNGYPSLTGLSNLTVIVGDINDNKMHSGSKSIFVYNYRGQYRNIPVGRVHVEDLDDWDTYDKQFLWENRKAHPNFALDETNGTIFMKDVIEGSYFLKFIVVDKKFTQTVQANVTIEVRNLPEEAVHNSGSIRFSGITDEDFIRVWDWKKQQQVKSKYEQLREILSHFLHEQVENLHIDIFSVVTRYREGRIPETDVRFAAHGSPYYKPSFLNGYIAINRRVIEKNLGLNITMVGIDECLNEFSPCDGSCFNSLHIEPSPHVVNANRTSLVGVHVRIVPKCECVARYHDRIENCNSNPYFCLNNGRCVMQDHVATCECLPGFTGPQCQITSRTFNGNGYAWFPALEQCENSHLSLEFMTQSSNGLLFYNGPVDSYSEGVAIQEDFISAEINNGRPKLIIDFGSGTSMIEINTVNQLDDGEWHRLDIFWNREELRMIVDHCQDARIDENSERPTMNRSQCEQKVSIRPYNEFLNLNTPLQMGGIYSRDLSHVWPNWKHNNTRTGFNGCIRNFIHNSRTYDLGSPGASTDSTSGCTISEERCQANSLFRSCEHGQCTGSYKSAGICLCDPGWTGDRCDTESPVKMINQLGFLRYALSFDPRPYKTDIQMRFRTRQKNGELMRISGKNSREYCVLEIKDSHLKFRYHLNQVYTSKEIELPLLSYMVADGHWHTVHVVRHGSTATIEADGGGGSKFNETTDFADYHQLLSVNKQAIIIGGDVNHMSPTAYYVENNLADSCITDVRIDDKHLPLENGSENAAVIESKLITDGCQSNDQCQKNQGLCLPPLVCHDLWNLHECTCPPGFIPTDDGGCTDDDECLSNPCLNGGTCLNLDNGQGFMCRCLSDFAGDMCNIAAQEKIIIMATRTWWIIVVAIMFLLLSSVGLFLVFRKTGMDQKYGQNDFDDDVRENIISYDDEGGGEDDVHAFDITPLRIPVDPSETLISRGNQSVFSKPGILKDPRKATNYGDTSPYQAVHSGSQFMDYTNSRLIETDEPDAASADDLRNYAYEGCGSTAGSLSSLTSVEGQGNNGNNEFDYLSQWGPRFQNLAYLYSQKDNADSRNK